MEGLPIVAPDADYHRRQAATLLKLAHHTGDPETAASLKQLAAEHMAIAEGATEKTNKYRPMES
jgi:hypothetical protein